MSDLVVLSDEQPFELLLEVPPGCEKGESLGLLDEELLRRLGGLYSRNATNLVRREIEDAKALTSGDYPGVEELTKAERARNVRQGEDAFVDGVFRASRERFGPKRKDGGRKPRGALGEMAGEIWSRRDLNPDVV